MRVKSLVIASTLFLGLQASAINHMGDKSIDIKGGRNTIANMGDYTFDKMVDKKTADIKGDKKNYSKKDINMLSKDKNIGHDGHKNRRHNPRKIGGVAKVGALNYYQTSTYYPGNLGIGTYGLDEGTLIPEEFRFCTPLRCYDLRFFAFNPVYTDFFGLPGYAEADVVTAPECYFNSGLRVYNMCLWSPAALSSEYYPLFGW